MVTVHIDCTTCVVRELACHDCVVSVLLGQRPDAAPETVIELGRDEQAALDALAGSGLVPPLRHQRDPDDPRTTAVPTRSASGSPAPGAPREPAAAPVVGPAVSGRRVPRPDAPALRLIQGAHLARAVQPSFDWEEFG